MLPCANQSEKPVSAQPPEACTSPELSGVAAGLLYHLVVRRGAGESPPFFSFFLEPTQWLSVRGLGKAEQKGSEKSFQDSSQPLLSVDRNMWLLQLHAASHTGHT